MREKRPVARSETEVQTQARSRLCRLRSRVFGFPKGASYRDLTGGVWQSGAVETLPFATGLRGLSPAPAGPSRGHFQAEHVRLFEPGCGFIREDDGHITAAPASL